MKRGFTLIELVASLIILSVVALIVTNNVLTHIRKYKEGLYEFELQTIESSSRNWMSEYLSSSDQITLTDIQTVVDGTTEYIYINLPTLKLDGFVDEDLYNPKSSEKFTDYVFVVVKCETIPANENNNATYKYTYTVIDTTDKLLDYIAKNILATLNDQTVYPLVYNMSDIFDIIPESLKLDGVSNKFIDLESGSLISSITITITSITEYTISI